MNPDEARPAKEADPDLATLDRHLAQLSEHFDNIQIFATKKDPNGQNTLALNRGCGNWYANYGQIHEWMILQNERTRLGERHENL